MANSPVYMEVCIQNVFISVKCMLYVSIIHFTYYNLYRGMMLGTYYNNITLRFLYLHSTIVSTGIMY